MAAQAEHEVYRELEGVLGGRAVRRLEVLRQFMEPGIRATTLSCAAPAHRESLVKTKLWMTALILLIDDLVDTAAERDWAAVEQVFAHMHGARGQELDHPIVRLGGAIWSVIETDLTQFPGWHALSVLVDQDWASVQLAFRRARALQQLPESYEAEHDTDLLGHDFGIVLSGMTDLMTLPTVDRDDLPTARRAFRAAQRVARLHNDMVTLDKELAEGDVCNAIILRALRQGEAPVRGGQAWAAVEAQLERARGELAEACGAVRCFDGPAYAAGVEELLAIQAAYYGAHHASPVTPEPPCPSAFPRAPGPPSSARC